MNTALIGLIAGLVVVGVSANWIATWQRIAFKRSDDWLAAQREAYAAQRNVVREMTRDPDQS